MTHETNCHLLNDMQSELREATVAPRGGVAASLSINCVQTEQI